jgi:hypothetical protein
MPLLQQNVNLHINLLSVISTNQRRNNSIILSQTDLVKEGSNVITFKRVFDRNKDTKFDFNCEKIIDSLRQNEDLLKKESENQKKEAVCKKIFYENLETIDNQLSIFKAKINKLNTIVGIKNKKFKIKIGIKITGNVTMKKNPILIIKVDIFNYLLKFNYPKIEFLVKNKISVLNLKKVILIFSF